MARLWWMFHLQLKQDIFFVYLFYFFISPFLVLLVLFGWCDRCFVFVPVHLQHSVAHLRDYDFTLEFGVGILMTSAPPLHTLSSTFLHVYLFIYLYIFFRSILNGLSNHARSHQTQTVPHLIPKRWSIGQENKRKWQLIIASKCRFRWQIINFQVKLSGLNERKCCNFI